jgi:RNA polymerase sigma-70 factor
MSFENTNLANLLDDCTGQMRRIYDACVANAPNFGVTFDSFSESLRRSVGKFLYREESVLPSKADIEAFLDTVLADDLFMAIACAAGNERAWWEFDQQHRAYLERISRHLASTDLSAQEVVDMVYVELYGTRVVEGERMSKFATYSGKGSIRGWLRTVVWHALVDMHRASHDEVSLDGMTEAVGEGYTHSTFAETDLGGEDQMMDHLSRERYKKATLESIRAAFSGLDDHEKLLLLYYHAEDLKLREIARLAESPDSPLRNWFQRRSAARKEDPSTRIHESTIMRWLDKTYRIVQDSFCRELGTSHGMREEEIEICIELATKDLADPDLYRNLASNA